MEETVNAIYAELNVPRHVAVETDDSDDYLEDDFWERVKE